MKLKLKPHIVPILSIIISMLIGLLCGDYFLGTITIITNIVYLVMNIVGIICWIKLENKQRNHHKQV